jgi:hypothetical protein
MKELTRTLRYRLAAFGNKRIDFIFGSFVGVVIGMIFSVILFYEPPPPIELHSMKLLTPEVSVSDRKLRFQVDVEWNKTCPTAADRFIFQASDPNKTVVWRESSSPIIYDRGRHVWIGEFMLPAALPPGEYIYRSRWTGQCPKGLTAIALPDMQFRLKPD